LHFCQIVKIFSLVGDKLSIPYSRDEKLTVEYKLQTVSIAEPMQNRQHAQNHLMLSTLGSKGKTEGG